MKCHLIKSDNICGEFKVEQQISHHEWNKDIIDNKNSF